MSVEGSIALSPKLKGDCWE